MSRANRQGPKSGDRQVLTENLSGMTTSAAPSPPTSLGRKMLNKVPEVTIYFWIIKILCTTVGETGADWLNGKLGDPVTKTLYVMSAILAVALAVQFALKRYLAPVYWINVVLISIVGTLITDYLHDIRGYQLLPLTEIFAVALAVVFIAWFAVEHTLSIHTIFTTRRESFYWLTILVTFALGTAAGDYVAESLLDSSFSRAILWFAGAIALITVGHYVLKRAMPAVASISVFAFWAAYILTRPLGASIGDYMSHATKPQLIDGELEPSGAIGLGLGTSTTSFIFLGTILALVVYLTATRTDEIPMVAEPAAA